jgi:protease-4
MAGSATVTLTMSPPASPESILRRLGTWPRRRFPPGRVAVVRLHGPIQGGGRTAEFVELLRHLRESKGVPAVVIDIDSPGGSATASDDLFLAIRRLAEAKPVVAAIRGVGASGAYLAALGAKTIVANPLGVVGSIGVISVGPRVPRLLERVGISVDETRAGRLKGMGAPWRDETDEERAKEQAIVDSFYDAFVERVATSRGLPADRVRELATGEVWLADQARTLGLIDQVGDVERAVEIAAELAGVPARAAPVRLRRPFVMRLVDRFATQLAASIADEVAERVWDRFRF